MLLDYFMSNCLEIFSENWYRMNAGSLTEHAFGHSENRCQPAVDSRSLAAVFIWNAYISSFRIAIFNLEGTWSLLRIKECVCMVFMAVITSMVVCARSQDSVLSTDIFSIHYYSICGDWVLYLLLLRASSVLSGNGTPLVSGTKNMHKNPAARTVNPINRFGNRGLLLPVLMNTRLVKEQILF